MVRDKKAAQLNRYLSKQGEQEAKYARTLLSQLPHNLQKRQYTYCVLIPCYDEKPDFTKQYNKLSQQVKKGERLLVILVINQSDEENKINLNNQRIWHQLTKNNLSSHQYANTLYLITSEQLSFFIVDRYSSHKIPKKQGVGLARKIGGDIACQWYLHNKLLSPWVGSTDADAYLPPNYFQRLIKISEKYGAQTFSFTHTDMNKNAFKSAQEKQIECVSTLYENKLHAYVKGLAYAKSPYAHYSVGSALAINLTLYAKVHGFVKKSAGEDFYTLNKLRKISDIYHHNEVIIKLQARLSNRTPFGTGPSVNALCSNKSKAIFYHPYCFILLKLFLSTLDTYLSHKQFNKMHSLDEHLFYINRDFLKNISIESKKYPTHTKHALLASMENNDFSIYLTRLKLDSFFNHLRQQNINQTAYLTHWHKWFDGLKTLQLIHYYEKNHFNSLDIESFNQTVKAIY